MVPPLALNHVEQQLQSIALSSARAREDIDRLFDAATAPVPAPETEDFESDASHGRPQPKTPPEPLGLHLLPEDLSAICAGYLRVADVVTYSACSEATREWYESEEPWAGFLEPLCLRESWWFGLEGDEDEPSARARVLHHAFSLRLAKRFLASASLLAGNAGTGEGRATARPLLAACAGLTATEALALRSGREPPTLVAQAIARGAIDPLLSLAGNEAKNFSGLACCVLANVIAVAEMHERLLGVLQPDIVAMRRALAAPPVYPRVSDSFEVLGARAVLRPLLTSPSACVAQTRTLTDALRVDLVRENISGAALEAIQDSTKQTCQGSASMHAARVLCNWHMPERAIASPGDDPIGGISKFPRLVAAIASADKWTLYNYSADNKSVISVCVLSMWIDAAGKVTGAGFDDRVAAGREQFTHKGSVEPKASMISISAYYNSFGPSSVGHYSYCLWADGVDGDIDGFFGIWEQASHDPHFELRRGGHCRLLPGDLTSTRAHRVHVRLESGLDYDYERERDRL